MRTIGAFTLDPLKDEPRGRIEHDRPRGPREKGKVDSGHRPAATLTRTVAGAIPTRPAAGQGSSPSLRFSMEGVRIHLFFSPACMIVRRQAGCQARPASPAVDPGPLHPGVFLCLAGRGPETAENPCEDCQGCDIPDRPLLRVSPRFRPRSSPCRPRAGRSGADCCKGLERGRRVRSEDRPNDTRGTIGERQGDRQGGMIGPVFVFCHAPHPCLGFLR